MNTDKINIPVDIALDPQIAAVIRQLKERLQKELAAVSEKAVSGEFPTMRPTIVGRQSFEAGGRKFEASGRAQLKTPSTTIEGEQGEIDLSMLMGFSATIKEVKDRLNKGMTEDQRRLKTFKDSIKFQPLDIKEFRIKEFIDEFGDINNELTTRLQAITQRIDRRDFKKISQDALTRPLEERELYYQEILQKDNRFHDEINRRIVAIRKQTGRKDFRESVADINLKPLEEREKLYQELLAKDKTFEREINRRIERTRQQLKKTSGDPANTRFQEVKRQASQLSLEDQFKVWNDYILSGDALVERANMELRKLSAKFVQSTRRMNRQKFTDWSKNLQLLDPSNAIAELDQYITAPFSKFITDAKIMRERIRRNMERQAQQSQKERQRQFANLALIGAGAGLGLLGPAGFPLLNIGFAAMSGGVVGAGIAAVATGLGEASRALEDFRQKTIKAAQDVGFVPKVFKDIEARVKGFDAVLGAITLSAQSVGMEDRLKIMKSNGLNWIDVNRGWTNVWESIKTRLTSGLNNASLFPTTNNFKPTIIPSTPGVSSLSTLSPTRVALNFFLDFYKREQLSKEREPEALETAYRAMIMQMRRPVGFENDPYQSWLRMQQAAFDPSKQLEMELLQKQIKEIKENTEALQERNRRDKIRSERTMLESFGATMHGMGLFY